MPKGGPFCALLSCELLPGRKNGHYMMPMHLVFCRASYALVISCLDRDSEREIFLIFRLHPSKRSQRFCVVHTDKSFIVNNIIIIFFNNFILVYSASWLPSQHNSLSLPLPHQFLLLRTSPLLMFMSVCFVPWTTEFNQSHLCDHGFGIMQQRLVDSPVGEQLYEHNDPSPPDSISSQLFSGEKWDLLSFFPIHDLFSLCHF